MRRILLKVHQRNDEYSNMEHCHDENAIWSLCTKGPYPLGDMSVIGGRIADRRSPCGYGLFIGRLGD